MEGVVGIDVAKDRLEVHLRPSGEAFAVARDGDGVARLVGAIAHAGPPAGGGQPSPGPRVCPCHRQTGQDRPARGRGHRSFRRGGAATGPADCRCRGAGPGRTGGAPSPSHRDDGCRAQPPPHGHPAPRAQGHRSSSRAAPGRTLRARRRYRRRHPQHPRLAGRGRSSSTACPGSARSLGVP